MTGLTNVCDSGRVCVVPAESASDGSPQKKRAGLVSAHCCRTCRAKQSVQAFWAYKRGTDGRADHSVGVSASQQYAQIGVMSGVPEKNVEHPS